MDADVTAPSSAPWSDAYVRARRREGRLLEDALVAGLPHLPAGHALHGEWRARADSCARLLRYLRAHPQLRTVVDAGCGNGWLAARMAAQGGVDVVGVDINTLELEQARRVFGDLTNVSFVQHDILTGPPPVQGADAVVLASVIQYVAHPRALVAGLLATAATVEVHILDSPVYMPEQVAPARSRTQRHYDSIGVPEMAAAYHHHDWRAFEGLTVDVLYQPARAWRQLERRVLRRTRSPFPWLRVSRDARRP